MHPNTSALGARDVYASICEGSNVTGWRSPYFVPRVIWKCGHQGFALDWTEPGPCPRCGAPYKEVDISFEPLDNPAMACELRL